MKKITLFLILFTFYLTSCKDGNKKESEKLITLGENVFIEKTCVSCHQLDAKIVGPSIKEIARVYREKNGNLVQFLKGKDAAIVDLDPGQVAIMETNLNGFVKDLSEDDLQALSAYIRNAK